MKITLVGVGKTKQSFVLDGMAFFKKRLSRFADFNEVILPEVKNAAKLSPALLKEKEAEEILKKVGGARFFILDEKGKQYTSSKFAEFLEKETVNGNSDLVFCVGGAYGFSDAVREKSSGMISLSSGTFTHQFIRLMFIEQIYRAISILNNSPYHNE